MSEPNDGFAIVGIGCRFPGGANSPEAFWELLRDGVDAITEIPADRFDLSAVYDVDPTRPGKLYARWGGFLERSRVDSFDAGFFGISPREAARIDPQHRLLLEVAWEALEDAGLAVDRLARHPVGVFVGVSTHDYGDIQMYPAHRLSLDAHSNTGTATSIAANRISYLYDFRGPSLTVDTACSSSLTAIHLACRSLRAGECELALVGGVQVLLVPELTIGFCKATMLSPDGRCKAFDASANGYVRSEGAGVVVLKPLAAALAAGDSIYAIIRGSAVNQDGHTGGLTVPSAAAQEAMVRAALVDAGMAARDVQYVEAHGTGTPVGDPIEAAAIGAALADGREPDERCAIGSVKSNIGHLEAASGMAGVIKTALALHHRQIPPTLHVQQLNPAIDFDGLQLRVVTELEPWPVAAGALAAAGVSSFGFGGSNAHVILQATPPDAISGVSSDPPPGASQLLTLSARGPEALRAQARSYVDLLSTAAAPNIDDVCAAAALSRAHLEHRVSVVASSAEDLVDGLDAFLAGDARANVVAAGRVPPTGAPALAFVFSGMGPQWWAMGRQLMASEPVFRDVIDRCDALLRPYAGFSLLEELSRDEATSRVGEADLAQMTNFAIQVALVALWESWGIKPDAVIGHSAGEMAAAYTAGALDLESAVRLAYHRSRLQSRAAGKGRMLAVGLPPEQLVDLLTAYGKRVCLAAVNSPSSVTLSGDQDALEALRDTLQERQVFARLLPVEVPYHSQHMDAIRDELLESLAALAPCPGRVPMVSVVTGDWLTGDQLDAGYWWRNVRQPVQFAAGVERLVTAGFSTFLEVGPHPVLGVSVAECVAASSGTRTTLLASLRRLEDERASMLRALAVLHAQGREVVWEAVYPAAAGRRPVHLPTYPWQRERHWLDLTAASNVDGSIDALPSEHPLLGRRVRAARPLWESRLSDQRLDYLDEHLVQGTLVFPGAAYVEMALAATRDAASPEGSIALRDVRFERALFIKDRSETLVQLGLDPERGRWEIHGRTGRAEPGAWTRHASGLFDHTSHTVADRLDLSAVRQACPIRLDREAFYAALHRRGLNLGGAFRALTELWVGEGEAVGAMELAESFDATPYTIHPALLDTAFQCLVGAVLGGQIDRDHGGVFLPVHLERVVLHATPATGPMYGHARMRSATGQPPEGDVTVVDATGQVCLSISGLRCQVLGAASADGASRGDLDDWLYEYRWEPKALERSTGVTTPIEAALTATLDLSPILERVQAEGDTRSAAWEWRDYYATIEARLNALAAAHVSACFAELGLAMEAREPKVVPEHQALFGRLLEIHADGNADPRDEDHRAALAEALLADAPAYEAEIRLLDRCGRHLADVLRGAMDAREVLFAEPALGLAARMYRDSPPSRVYNTLTAETVAALLDGRTAGRPPRVLEVGGGTGGTTAYVLPRLAEARAEYTFTDISPLFTERARVELGSFGRLVTQPLDIERDPVTQGFAPHSFDVVVAANVLHATADLQTSLRHVNRLLAPGGVLVIQEITRNPFWLDLIFGLTEGWWRFTDRELRPAHPLLAEQQWRALLERSGFEDVGVMGDSLPTGGSAQAVIVGRSPAMHAASQNGVADGAALTSTGEWLIFADTGGVGTHVADRLVSLGHRCRLVERGRFAAGAVDAADVDGVLADVGQGLDDLRGVVYLWGLDVGADADSPTRSLLDTSVDACADALAIIQAIGRRERLSCNLTIVTRGSQPTDNALLDAQLALGQAPLWGLARVAMREQARLRCRLIDLDPGGGVDVSALVDDLLEDRSEREEEVAYRADERLIRRLRRVPLASLDELNSANEPRAGDEPFRVTISTPGALDTLGLARATRRPPGPGEVELEVHAASLNFRDVMLAMGLLSPLATEGTFGRGELGIDCAGTIVACGEGVDGFAPGDAVLGIAAGALASHVTTSALLVAPVPSGYDAEQASTMLCAFVTAEYALLHLARMCAGERVLIHAATGGVGLAAIQIAQAAGAEIFATAGSAEKRAYLASLGVQHIMDSRSLQFADDILEQTHGEGVDIVLNSLAGPAISKGLGVLRPYGRFVEIGKRDIYSNSEIGLLAFRKNQAFFALDLDRLCAERSALVGSLIRDVTAKMASGVYQAPVHTTFPVSRVEDAMRHMSQARHMGKVVLSLNDPDVRLSPSRRAAGSGSGADLFRSDGTYLISGGLGGFGLATAEWMTRQGAGTLVLVGRSEASADAADALARLRAAGARVEVRRADISDAEASRRLVDQIRAELPPLRGIVHAAMVLDDAPLQQLDRHRLQHVMAPKLAGAWNLHTLTLGDPLDYFILFSSIASLLGNPLQANYAAANAVFGPLAHHRRALGLPALSVDWGVLSGVGYLAHRPEVAEHLARQGYLAFDGDQALGVLGELLRRDVGQIMAARMDWRTWARSSPTAATAPHLLDLAIARESVSDTGSAASREPLLARLNGVGQVGERRGLVATFLRERVARILGTSPSKLDLEVAMADLGFDSLMAVELTTVLSIELGVELGVVKLLQGVSLQGLADLILEELQLATPVLKRLLHRLRWMRAVQLCPPRSTSHLSTPLWTTRAGRAASASRGCASAWPGERSPSCRLTASRTCRARAPTCWRPIMSAWSTRPWS